MDYAPPMLARAGKLATDRGNEVVSPPQPAVPLQDFPFDFAFCSDGWTLCCQGAEGPVPRAESGSDLAAAVDRALAAARQRGQGDPLCVGAIPFDLAQPHRLFVPRQALRFRGLGAPPQAPAALPGGSALRSDRAGFARAVARALQVLQASELRKVVLSRCAELTLGQPVEPRAVVARLARANPRGYTFGLRLDCERPPRVELASSSWLVGASPELLLQRSGRYVVTNPLAGTRARAGSAAEEQRRRRELFDSEKERLEHRVVVEAIRCALLPYCRTLSVPSAPSIVETPSLMHLSTLIVGELREDAPSSLGLALALHPTPAVCGSPTGLARGLIRDLEGYDRGLFTGLVGYCDHAGDGRWAVTLRCGELSGSRARLFAGAGIVVGSDPQTELSETDQKLGAMLSALGCAEAGGA